MKYFFQGVSIILHPLLMPLLGFAIFFETQTIPRSLILLDALYYFPAKAKEGIYMVMAILTILAPGLSLLIMYWNKMISDLELSKRKERFYPFVLIIFYYGLAFGFLKMKVDPSFQHPAMMSFIFGIILVFAVSFLLNFYVKLSMHAAGIFGVAGAVTAYFQTQAAFEIECLIYLLICGGLVGTSRMFLKAHSLKETMFGIAVGFFVMFLSVKYSIYI